VFDPEIKAFYDSVKDPSWAEISEYKDFVALDPDIKKECFDQHGFQNRLDEITDLNHWINESTFVCVFKDLAYVPVPKCAYSYYTQHLTELGWKKVKLKDVDIGSTHFFGFVMHPLKRYLKGVTQMLVFSHAKETQLATDNPWHVVSDIDWDSFKYSLESKYVQNLIKQISIGDEHSTPYQLLFGNFLNKVHWIPMDLLTDNEIKLHVINFCKQHGHDLSLPLDDYRIHQSSELQLQAYNIIKNNFFEDKELIYKFYKIFGADLKFFYKLLDNFKKKL